MNKSAVIVPQSRKVKCAEVAAFMRRGFDLDESCRMVGIEPYQFLLFGDRSEPIQFLPTPAEIREITLRIQAGERVCSARSQRRWISEGQKLDAGESDAFELAGVIADDGYELPAWLYSAG